MTIRVPLSFLMASSQALRLIWLAVVVTMYFEVAGTTNKGKTKMARHVSAKNNGQTNGSGSI